MNIAGIELNEGGRQAELFANRTGKMGNNLSIIGPIKSISQPSRKTVQFLQWIFGLLGTLAASTVLIQPATALPSFADQTSLQCSSCHIGSFGPALTQTGRDFKLSGYVWDTNNASPVRVSAMLQSYLTHTEKSQPGGAAPHFGDNDNLSVSQVSFFYGGKIAGKLGAFFQATYDGVGRRLAWDNLDIRYADTAKIGNVNATLGISVNNNPTVQDLWNTTPAWGTPFSGTDLAPSPAAAPLIAGGLAQQVIGVSAYAMWDGWLYTEIGGYRRLSNRLQTILGVSPAGENTVSGVAPYWRVTAQHDFGDHYLSLGTFGISSKLYPGQLESAGTDRTTDIGLDLSYEYIGDEDNFISAYSSFISEHQSLSASSVLGVTSNSSNYLRSVNTTVSYTYLQTYTGSLGYFDVWGSSDAALYSGSAIGSPDSRGFTAEVDYTPFGKADAPFGNRLNLRLGLQYTGYFKFDGSKDNYDGAGRNASDNNTLALMAWFMF